MAVYFFETEDFRGCSISLTFLHTIMKNKSSYNGYTAYHMFDECIGDIRAPYKTFDTAVLLICSAWYLEKNLEQLTEMTLLCMH